MSVDVLTDETAKVPSRSRRARRARVFVIRRVKNTPHPPVTFTEQTPRMQIGDVRSDPLYEKAFFSSDLSAESEFARNTMTWD